MTGATGELLTDVSRTVVHLLASAAAQSPTAEALVFGEIRLTYEEYYQRAQALTHELTEAGVANRRVATILGNSADTCIAFSAVSLGRSSTRAAQPALHRPRATADAGDAEPVHIIADESLGARVTGLVEQLAADVLRVGEHARRLADPPVHGAYELPLPEPDSLALLQYTAGRRGARKGCR